jgi:WD40 repeat protein
MVKLIPDGLRAGSRNKHIDAFSVSEQGLLAGGTNQGEIYLWRINFQSIRQRKSDGLYQWVNCFKIHKKANHYVEFNPSGNILMTGSADGSAALWDTSFVEKKLNMQPDEEILPLQSQMLPLKNMDISEETLITKIEEPQVDGKKTES